MARITPKNLIDEGSTIHYLNYSGNEFIYRGFQRVQPKHIRHLNIKVALPVFHASTIYNISKSGNRAGRVQFKRWSPKYALFRKKAKVAPHTLNKQPRKLGRVGIENRNKILILSGRLFHHLGTANYADSKKIMYGINADSELANYYDAVISGRPAGVRVVTVPAHERAGYTKKNGVEVRSHYVKEHKKKMKTGRLPARNPFFLTPKDRTILSKAYLGYFVAPLGKESIKIDVRALPVFRAPQHVTILKN